MKDENVKFLSAGIIAALLGVLLCVYRSGILDILFTLLGAVLIVWGIVDIVLPLAKKQSLDDNTLLMAIAKILVGVLFIVGGWVFVDVLLYIAGAVLIAYGVYMIITGARAHVMPTTYITPALLIAVGILIIVSPLVDVLFIVAGVAAIIYGVWLIVSAFVFSK